MIPAVRLDQYKDKSILADIITIFYLLTINTIQSTTNISIGKLPHKQKSLPRRPCKYPGNLQSTLCSEKNIHSRFLLYLHSMKNVQIFIKFLSNV